MTNLYTISPNLLTYDVLEKAASGELHLAISEESVELIQRCRDYLDRKMKSQKEPIYGITTGFGSLCNRSISEEALSQLQENLVMSHACSTGNEVAPEIIRLMLFLKAHALSLGKSGVQIVTVQRIVDFYNNDVLPIVYDRGSLGASGDLAPLSNLFLPLIGKGDVRYKGEKRDASDVLKELGWEPIKLQSKEGLALLNGTQFMSSHGVLAMIKAFHLAKLADVAGALSLEAFDGRIEPFNELLHQIRPHQGQLETALNIRKIVEGSELIARPKKHVQDPYSFRCMPQVHGASKDTIAYVANVILTEVNSVTDNPTVFVDEDLILSGGNFHGQPLALALDFLAIALAELGNISERRVAQLILGLRGLPEFLVANPGLNSGYMIPQYAAAAMVSQNKQLCTPASVDSIVSSNGQEDHVSMGANSATKLLRVIDNLERILAIELMNASQAIEFRRPAKTSPYLEEFLSQFRNEVPFVEEDIVMYQAIDRAVAFIREGAFVKVG
jgi:histidine ammonia-lyase